jgi:hypothetical protein
MQAGYGYPQQLVPGMRPGGAPMPNFFVPMVQQGQQGQRPGGRRGAGPMQQLPQSMPMMQQQVCSYTTSRIFVLFLLFLPFTPVEMLFVGFFRCFQGDVSIAILLVATCKVFRCQE